MELKSPDEIVRCLRQCMTDCDSCKDGDGNTCGYYENRRNMRCLDMLMSDAADVIAATYNNREG